MIQLKKSLFKDEAYVEAQKAKMNKLCVYEMRNSFYNKKSTEKLPKNDPFSRCRRKETV